MSFNLGVRYDENDGKDAAGKTVAKDDSISPRVWPPPSTPRPTATGCSTPATASTWRRSPTASATRPPRPASRRRSSGPTADRRSTPATRQTRSPRTQALAILFDWFNSAEVGGPANRTFLLRRRASREPTSRSAARSTRRTSTEYTVGVSKRLGGRGIVPRRPRPPRLGRVLRLAHRPRHRPGPDATGSPTDLTLVENNDDLYERTYDGLHTQFRYRLNDRLDLGGNWTLSHTEGNFDGETRDNGPVTAGLQNYPEYKEARWNYPKGDLSADQRHKLSLYGVFRAFSTDHHSLNVSLLQQFNSGLPYGAVGSVRSSLFVPDPGYETPPARVTYYFTARDEFRTDDILRTDLSLNYAFKFRDVELFLQPEMLNIFDAEDFDTTDTRFLDQSVASFDTGGLCNDAPIDPITRTRRCLNFNPFTDTPVEGVHWQKGANFGNPINQNGYQRPRTYRFSVGIRF